MGTMDFSVPSSPEHIQKAIQSLIDRGIEVKYLETKESALEQLKSMIPAGASIMTGASVTLEQIGFITYLMEEQHPWNYLKKEILKETDSKKRTDLRRKATSADYYIGSVHGISEDGEIVIASATGSQIPAYAYTSPNIIWVAGIQKIVPNLDLGIRRIREYAYPREDLHMKKLYGDQSGSLIGKILIYERESPLVQRKIHLLLVNETLGF